MRLQAPIRLYRFLLAALLLLFSMILQADGGWQQIGEKHITPSQDTATIKISSEGGDTPYKTVKFHITQGSLKIRSAKVHMSDGQVVDLSIQKLMLPGLETRGFPIPDHGRSIKKIVLYIEAPLDHSSNVVVYGVKADTSEKKS
ncbi:hypothetical protein [Endozoicomonas sp. 8E]|uniref:hypothetical protein n=1 Tax=Endozoicomonas sp. 8E TaxID=3035692 RepID=UPI002938FC00|nr:hypothetical protein [Endozoicomonas sp. 8E]WOG27740.1 hypothetical protein P6910_24860 [Endozoicomonas sp. 8E]